MPMNFKSNSAVETDTESQVQHSRRESIFMQHRQMISAFFARFHATTAEFAEETGFFGLHLLVFRTRLSNAETIFWLVCTAFFCCCTVRDLVNMSLAFLSEETVSLTSRQDNSTIIFDPAPSLAFKHHLSESFAFDYLPNETHLQMTIDRFLVDYTNFTASEVNASLVVEMDETLFQLTATMLMSMLRGEGIIGFRSEPNTSTEWAFAYKERGNFQLIKSAVKNVYQRYVDENIDFSVLLQLVSMQICRYFSFTLTWKHKDSAPVELQPCEPSDVQCLDTQFLTLRTLGEPLTFDDYDSELVLSWDDPQPTVAFLDLAGTPQTTLRQEPTDALFQVQYGRIGEKIDISVRVNAVYMLSEAKTLNPCMKTPSKYDCEQACLIERFVFSCECHPLFFLPAYVAKPGTPTCPYSPKRTEMPSAGGDLVDYFEGCRNASGEPHLDERLLSCFRSNCLPNCYSKTFVTTLDRQLHPNDTRNWLTLTAHSFTFQLIEEKLDMTFDTFVSQFDGTLGLYVGVSFAALLHIPVYLVRKAVQRYSKKKAKTTGAEGRESRAAQLELTSDGHFFESASFDDLKHCLEHVLVELNTANRRLAHLEEQMGNVVQAGVRASDRDQLTRSYFRNSLV